MPRQVATMAGPGERVPKIAEQGMDQGPLHSSVGRKRSATVSVQASGVGATRAELLIIFVNSNLATATSCLSYA